MTHIYRNTTEIVMKILESAAEGHDITKTQLMYKAFLSYEQLKQYLPILIENGLLDCDESKRYYKVTEKGTKFIRMFNEIVECVSIMPAAVYTSHWLNRS